MSSHVTGLDVSIQPTSKTNTMMTAMLLFVVGIGLVYISGFANLEALHNGAHDSRHSLVFPCH